MAGDVYYIPGYARHRPAVQCFLRGEFYEPRTHRFVSDLCAAEEGSMIHAGTFFGDMLPSFSRSVRGVVYAFEPVLENYVLAKGCINANGLLNVQLHNAALGADSGNVFINTSGSDGRHAGGASRVSSSGEICTVLTIDSIASTRVVLIQLDVEGSELAALQGAVRTIGECRPVVAMEDNSRNCSEFLMSLGYAQLGEMPGLSVWAPDE